MNENKPNFWIIDDDPNIFELISQMIPEYNFTSLSNRKMVVNEVNSTQPCAGIILDYKLKYNVSGFDLIPMLRKMCPKVPILLLTAFGSKEIVLQTLRAKIDSYQDKPINFKELKGALKAFAQMDYGNNFQNMTYDQHIQNIDSLLSEPSKQRTSLKIISYNNQLSYKYISKKYKKETGHTFSEQQMLCIIETAKELLLTTPLSVKEIAKRLGYQYPSSFMRLFKNQTGMTALQYKKKGSQYDN